MGVFSLPSELLLSFQESCRWWVENQVNHDMLSPQQKQNWDNFCQKTVLCKDIESLLELIETYLEPRAFSESAFFTGYYEPTLKGSLTKSDVYPVPLYSLPDNPKFSRQEIRQGALKDQGCELVYVDDAVDAFFLEIQGSGRIELKNGDVLRLGYAGQNGFPYTAIGKVLKESGKLTSPITMDTIKTWLRTHLDEANEVMDQNRSYVFFKKLPSLSSAKGPLGTQKLPLSPMMSVACDTVHWPFGMLIHYDLQEPSMKGFALTQDTGGAIKGPLRFDLFCGHGREAESLAGNLQTQAKVTAFLPKDRKCE